MEEFSVQLRGLEKRFASNKVLRGVDLDIPSGKITVLMGANGAGKSTLVKIVCGVHRADSGTMTMDGVTLDPLGPADAIRSGVVTVHQSINDGIIPDLDVAANLMLDKLADPKGGVFYNYRDIRRQARDIAARLGLDLDVKAEVSGLSLADRQLVSIARAMAHEPKLMILDEPTSSLSASEANRLFTLLEKLRSRGVAILYISHRMSDIRRVADRIVSMRDGTITGVFEGDELDYEGAVNAMLGRSISDFAIDIPSPGEAVLELKDIQLKAGTKPFSLTAHRNEVIAITGLVGVGKTNLAELLYGVGRKTAGEMRINGKPYAPKNVGNAIQKGVFLCAKDRGSNGVIPEFDINRNISLPFLKRLSNFGFVRRSAERDIARNSTEELGVVCQSIQDNIGSLSGGNQQKVMVARWLSHASQVLVLDEPFQGVDIAARRDIGQKIRETAGDRATIVMVAELDEALEIADRILVMAEFTLVGEHANSNVDIDLILEQVAGGSIAVDAIHQVPKTTDVNSTDHGAHT